LKLILPGNRFFMGEIGSVCPNYAYSTGLKISMYFCNENHLTGEQDSLAHCSPVRIEFVSGRILRQTRCFIEEIASLYSKQAFS
jgi:hypothetical protein